MNERSIHLSSGKCVVIRGELDDETMDWGASFIATSLAPRAFELVPSSGLLIGGILCALEQEGDALRITEPDLDRPASPSEPDTYVPGVTRALALAYEQHRVHASYDDAPSLRENLFHNSRVTIGVGWSGASGFAAVRRAPLGSHSGWEVHRDEKSFELGRTEEVSVRDVITKRPMLARFLMWPKDTFVSWLGGSGPRVQMLDSGSYLYARTDSYVGLRTGRRAEHMAPIQFDPVAHAEFIALCRSQTTITDRISERFFVPYDVAKALSNNVERFVAQDHLYSLDFIRKLRTLLRQEREALALQEIERAGKLTPEEAHAFLAYAREWIVLGKVPPRST